ncbi:o-succinylbenzoate--CoA ligase [Klebsiella pneumoniae]|uniref:2-succinylbenzoate--CoA ligase n=1 Tax=Klebsiella pneumoniae TaxID=573 RepID=UPI000BB0CD0C|nr:2-succinylbenzoate--CoA ligase [Klebsiella pneumoniae]PBD54872.1 o-succinylbenzoate--CoA ligase [Klebsiella pneumoniae]
MTFNDWPWRHWHQRRGEALALRLNNQPLTWRELCARVDALASGFAAQGVMEGQGVAIRAYNQPETLLAWLALLQCGARVLPLNPQLPAVLLQELLPALTVQHQLVLNGDTLPGNLPALTLQAAEGACAVCWHGDRLVSMTLTSGSTGLPKAAARLTVRDKQPLAQMLHGCTHASLVPTQLWRLLNDDAAVSLKAVLLGGASIPVELTERARKQGIRSFCGYGLTEFASTVCAKEADGAADVGEALPGREVKIVAGEIWLRASSMAAGYWRDGQLLSLTNNEGWFATRDRGALHNGRLTIVGRLDNLFFSGGEGIQPEEVERVILAHPQVQQVFIVPLDDAEYGQRPVAVVECDDGCELSALAAWSAERLARFQQPVRWLRLPETLKNGGIKISRRALCEWVRQQTHATVS